MNSKIKLKRIYLPLLIAFLVTSVAFRTAALLIDFDTNTGYFGEKILIRVASIILLSGAFLLFTYSVTADKKQRLIADFSTPATYVPTGVISVALMFFAAMMIVKKSNSDVSLISYFTRGIAPEGQPSPSLAPLIPEIVISILVPLSLLSIGYFVLNACVIERASTARAGFGIINVVFLVFYASFLYFDKTLAINAPNKIIDQMAFIFAALFFLYEVRISIGREVWNLYMSFGFVAALILAYSSVPSLILYFVKGTVVSNNIQENVLTFSLFIFIISRLFLAASLKEDKMDDNVSLMREAARERNSFIEEKEELARQAYLELYGRLDELEDSLEENEDVAYENPEDALLEKYGSDSEMQEDEDGLYQMSLSDIMELDAHDSTEIESSEDDIEIQEDEEADVEEVDLFQETIVFPEDITENSESTVTDAKIITESDKKISDGE